MRASRSLMAVAVAVTLGLGVYAAIRIHQVQATPDPTSEGAAEGLSAVGSPQGSIYPPSSQAAADIERGLASAVKANKRVILDFGGDWCPDCRVLDIYFHNPANRPILERNYVLVHVNVGRLDENLDIAAKYGVPLQKGVPALAVLAPDGRLLYSQRDGQFEAMRNMDPESVTKFLERWKP